METGIFSWGQNGRGVAVMTHPHLAPSLSMSSAVRLLLLYACMALTGTTLPLLPTLPALVGIFV
jgi:hypothetical protein